MTSEHLDAVIEIERECFFEPWSKEAIYNHMESPLGIGYVASRKRDDGNEIVCGYCCGLVVGDEALLYRIACIHLVRRQRVASMLLTSFLEDVAQRGALNCYLEVEASNNGAKLFYERHGFETIGRRPKYYAESGQDALIMHRTTSAHYISRD